MMKQKLLTMVALLCCCLLFAFSAYAAADRVVIYTAAEDERIAYLQEELNRQFPGAGV